MEGKVFSEEFLVRDYEVDMFGVVNNSVYQNYFEHTRHLFLAQIGFDLLALAESGNSAVVAAIKIKYKFPLRSKDRFISTIRIRKSESVRRVFVQKIFLKDSKKPIADGEVTCVFVNEKGNPVPPSQAFLNGIAPYTI